MRTLLLAALLLPAVAAARPTLGLRAGWAPSFGDASKTTPMDEVAQSQLPVLQLDALWRFGGPGGRFAAGAYYSYGLGQLGDAISDACDAQAAECSVRIHRLGLQATYAITQLSLRYVPWLGAGIGYEWANERVAGAAGSVFKRDSGWEFLNLQAGGDFAFGSRWAVGPFVQLSFGRYSSADGNAIAEKAWHEWLTLGLRGKVDL